VEYISDPHHVILFFPHLLHVRYDGARVVVVVIFVRGLNGTIGWTVLIDDERLVGLDFVPDALEAIVRGLRVRFPVATITIPSP